MVVGYISVEVFGRQEYSLGLQGVGFPLRVPEGFGAKAAGAGADVSQDLECEGSPPVAMGSIGAAGFLAHRVEPKAADVVPDAGEGAPFRQFLL